MPSPLSNFISELRRRRVFRVAAVYAGVAFIVFQIVDATFEPLHLPDWAGTLVVVLLVLGFPIAVGLAWAFDITEQGVVRTAKEPAEAKAPRRVLIGNRALAIIAAVAVAVAVWSWLSKQVAPSLPTSPDSIAVMYFENLTGDPSMDWIEAGIVEMLTANLGRLEGLNVLSSQRLSDIVRQITGGESRRIDRGTATQVAEKAGVGTMLLGSVLGSKDQLLI